MLNILPLFHIRDLFLFLSVFVLSGCSLLPSQGPSLMDVALMEEPLCESTLNYVVVPINPNVVEQLGHPTLSSLETIFKDTFTGNKGIKLGIGDDLLVNIWEASGDGLFSTFDKKQVRIGVTVDENGKIYIPYVGHIIALGKDIENVRKTIENGLIGKAVEPQVQVSLNSNVSNNIAIVGDIVKPGQYPVPIGGIRLIEAIALAGGTQQTTFDTEITIVRGQNRGTARFDEILNYPVNNVWLVPQDTVQLINKPRTFTAFGAVLSNNHLPFKTETVSIAEALAQCGGLNDRLADAGGVFIFRFESPLRLNNAQIKKPKKLYGDLAATIYKLDFKQPQAFFHASSFLLQDKDIIYVANAPAAELSKFLSTIVLPTLSAARSNSVIVGH